ncbi:MAG: thioesterase family protein [Bacteroidota bacterium]|nr:thioesterase family protein [Bacteroidota bacterium]
MPFERNLFHHVYPFRVRSFHVDRQNVVHNVWYFFFLEEARVEYLRSVGFPIDDASFVGRDKFLVAHNACSYHTPALFDDALVIRTRVARVGNTSLSFEHIIEHAETGRIIAEATHVLVHVDAATERPAPLSENLRKCIEKYERGE